MDFGSSPKRTLLSLWPTKDVNDTFHRIALVGSGVYGLVYKAHYREDKEKIIALKKIDVSKETEGFPVTALREIKILQKLNHPNIIQLIEVVTSKDNINDEKGYTYLVFEYMEHDFWGLLKKKITFSLPQIKCIMKQLLEGLNYLHDNNVIHRDIKGANLLLNNKGVLKIADFGLARMHTKRGNYTNRVVTLLYRPPELLLGCRKYSSKIDIWSAGCFFAEFFLGDHLFKGDREAKQLELIYEKCGAPDPETWPEVKSLPYYAELGPNRLYVRSLTSYLRLLKPNFDENALDLIDKMLELNPERRLTAKQCLEHKFFSSIPIGCEVNQLPRIEHECHGSPNIIQNFPNQNQFNNQNRGFQYNNNMFNRNNFNNNNNNNNNNNFNWNLNNNIKNNTNFFNQNKNFNNENNRRYQNFYPSINNKFGQSNPNSQMNVKMVNNSLLTITINSASNVQVGIGTDFSRNQRNPNFQENNEPFFNNINNNNLFKRKNSNHFNSECDNINKIIKEDDNNGNSFKRKISSNVNESEEYEKKNKILKENDGVEKLTPKTKEDKNISTQQN